MRKYLIFILMMGLFCLGENARLLVPQLADATGGVCVRHFFEITTGKPEVEPTAVRLYHDAGRLHIAVEAQAFVLHPDSNQRGFFKMDHREHDSDVWADDSIEIRISPQGKNAPYYICYNAAGAMLDTVYRQGDWDKSWTAPATVRNSLEAGVWKSFFVLDLRALGYPEERCWDVNILRFNQAKKSLSCWMPLVSGSHTSPENFIRMELSEVASFVELDDFVLPLRSGEEIPFRYVGEGNCRGEIEFWEGKKLRSSVGKTVSKGTHYLEVPEVKGKHLKAVLSFHDSDKRLLMRSTPYDYSSASREIHVKLQSAAPFSIFLNGCGESCCVKKVDRYLPLRAGCNRLRFTSDSGTEITGEVIAAGHIFPVDKSWRTPERNRLVLEKAIVFQGTSFQPYVLDSWTLTEGGAYTLFLDGSGMPGEPLRNLRQWRLELDVPPALELLGIGWSRYQLTAVQKGDWTRLEKSPEFYRLKQVAPGKYEVEAKGTFSYLCEKHTWLEQIAAADRALYLTFRAKGKVGSRTGLGYRMTAENGRYEELPRTLPVEILPPLKGVQPKRMSLMIRGVDGGTQQDSCNRAYFKTLRSAGLNELVGTCYTDDLKRIGIRQYEPFNIGASRYLFSPSNKEVIDMCRVVPEVEGLWNGRKMTPVAVNAYTLAHVPGVLPFLGRMLDDWKKLYPSLSGIWWDYEYKPFPTGIMKYPAFSSRAIREFARQHGLKGELTDLILWKRYPSQWIDFSCQTVADMFKVVRSIARAKNLEFLVYSGYQGDPICKSSYTMDWKLAGKHVDRAYCGYGLDRKNIAMTRRCLSSGRLVGGLLKMGKRTQRNSSAQIVRLALECGSGVLLWYENRFDGSTLLPVAEASLILAAAEDYILDGQRCDARILVATRDCGDVAAFAKNDRIAVIFMNDSGKPRIIRYGIRTLDEYSVLVPAGGCCFRLHAI